jgi:hypothetical protein|tara:strand:+ start:14005 stop:14118 length:114 start_codon:yes stop_codon:yes gene_type:complete
MPQTNLKLLARARAGCILGESQNSTHGAFGFSAAQRD